MLRRIIGLVLVAVAVGATASAQERLKPGETFRDCPGCPEMVVIPAGSFMMGSPASEAGRDRNEGPRHRVTIPRAFALGKYEVTFAEWYACADAGGCSHRPEDPGWGRGNRPVIYVNWNDAHEYVRWLSRKTGRDYRLPSEAEWEYAARAGTITVFHFGDRISLSQANYGESGGRSREQTVAVGSFPANAFGLHDVHGNVYEWAEDCWNGSYEGAPTDGNAWTKGGCRGHMLRGGSWVTLPRGVRAAHRYALAIGLRIVNNGFRIAMTLP